MLITLHWWRFLSQERTNKSATHKLLVRDGKSCGKRWFQRKRDWKQRSAALPNLHNLYHFFLAPKTSVSDIQNDSLSKIILELRQNTCFKVQIIAILGEGNRLLLLTKYAFMRSGQKIWARPYPPSFEQNPKEQLLFFMNPSHSFITQVFNIWKEDYQLYLIYEPLAFDVFDIFDISTSCVYWFWNSDLYNNGKLFPSWRTAWVWVTCSSSEIEPKYVSLGNRQRLSESGSWSCY